MKYNGKSKKVKKHMDRWKYRLIRNIVNKSTKQQWSILTEKSFGRIEYPNDPSKIDWHWDIKTLINASFDDLKEIDNTLPPSVSNIY